MKIKSLGFVNLITIKKGKKVSHHATCETNNGVTSVRKFRTMAELKLFRIALKAKKAAARSKQIAAAFLKSARLEAAIITARAAFKKALFMSEDSYAIAKLHLSIARALHRLQEFRSSLPTFVRAKLF